MTNDVNKLVALYVRLRDEQSVMEKRHKEELAPFKKGKADIEARMMQVMQELKTESLKTKAGTAYQTKRVSATVADRETFKSYCETEDAWYLADIRVSKTAVRAQLDETGELPPGINWREDIGINFKR